MRTCWRCDGCEVLAVMGRRCKRCGGEMAEVDDLVLGCAMVAMAEGYSLVRKYGVDMSEAVQPDIAAYASFNDFFTRERVEGARPVDGAPASLVSPVDGILSAAGRIDGSSLLQAKGIHYTLEDLLATDLDPRFLARLAQRGLDVLLGKLGETREAVLCFAETPSQRLEHGRACSINGRPR